MLTSGWQGTALTAAPIVVLDVDPDLAAAIDPASREQARAASTAPALHFGTGPWNFVPPHDPGTLGALIAEGLVFVRVAVGGRAHVELLGEGDVISPWVGMGSGFTLPSVVSAEIVAPARIALLDRAFAIRTAPWPELQGALIHRLIVRARRLNLQSAINAVTRIDERLELTLWQLADRFGRVTADGTRLHLPLTHAQLAEMIGAQRPSVTMALAKMRRENRLRLLGARSWLLCGPVPTTFGELAPQTAG